MKFININMDNSSIFFDRTYTFFSMVGDDAISFLDRMTTNNIASIKSSKTVITTNKASIIDLLTYRVLDEKKIIFVSETESNRSIDYMKKYFLIDDVEINHLGELKKLVIFSGEEISNKSLEKFSLYNSYENKDLFRYELFVEDREIEKLNDFKKISSVEKNLLDIRMKYVNFNESMLKANPLELGFGNIISFDKGCYVGQEVIARLQNYKKVSREVLPFNSKSELKPNSKIIFKSKNIGNVLSIQKNSDEFLGLCLVKKRFSNLFDDEFIKI